MSTPLSLSLKSASQMCGLSSWMRPLRKRCVCSCSRRSWLRRLSLAAAADWRADAPPTMSWAVRSEAWCGGALEDSAAGSEVAGRRRRELKRLREKGLVVPAGGGVRSGSEGMPESVCGRGRRWCSVLGLRAAAELGRLSMKLWMEPLRWREGAGEADEKDESLLRLFWRVKGPVRLPRARARALSPWAWLSAPSLTASRARPYCSP